MGNGSIVINNRFRYALIYIFSFITSPKFLHEQRWFQTVVGKLAAISCNTWTASRCFGSPITLLAVYLHPIFGLIAIIFFALTDIVDGPVAIRQGKAFRKFGAVFDAVADKIFIHPLLIIWGGEFIGYEIFWANAIIDGGGNPFLAFADKFIFKKKSQNIFAHSLGGKYKFVMQVILVIILWYAKYYAPNWKYWPLLLYPLAITVIVLAIASVIGKLKNNKK